MLTYKKRKKTRKNAARKSARRKPAARKARKKARKPAGKRIRPVIYKSGKSFRRSSRSRTFGKGPVRINKRRKTGRRTRRNPVRGLSRTLTSKAFLMQIGAMGAGVAGGFIAIPHLVSRMPAAIQAQRKFFGLLPVILGALVMGMAKGKNAKNFGVGVAASGVLDLLSQNVAQLGLPVIPSAPLGANYDAPRRPISSIARKALGASYSPGPGTPYVTGHSVGASYEAPGMKTAGFDSNDPYSGISW